MSHLRSASSPNSFSPARTRTLSFLFLFFAPARFCSGTFHGSTSILPAHGHCTAPLEMKNKNKHKNKNENTRRSIIQYRTDNKGGRGASLNELSTYRTRLLEGARVKSARAITPHSSRERSRGGSRTSHSTSRPPIRWKSSRLCDPCSST